MKTSYSNKFIRSASSTGGLSKTLYLTKTKPISQTPSISKASTDDMTFGSSEMKQIDRIKMKKTTQTQEIWYKAPNNNIYDTKANNNHYQIKTIKAKVRNTSEQSNFDLRAEIERKKYFSLELVDAIYESEQIRKKLQVQKRKQNEIVDMYTFRKQNKEICLQNNMIDLLKNEMNKVSNKENEIQTALVLSKMGMESDMKLFDELVIDHKRIERERNSKLNEATQYNKILHEKKKELTHNLKVIQEDIERHLRQISQFKTYADFVHLTFNYSNEIENVVLGNIEYSQRDKDFAFVIKKVVNQFAFLDKYDRYHPWILDDPDQLAVFFDQVDGNIRKAINERNALIDEIYHKRVNYEKILGKIEQKESELKQDLVTLSKYDLIEKKKLATLPTRYHDQIKENTYYLNSLYECLKEGEKSTSNIIINNNGTSSSNVNNNSNWIKTAKSINDIIRECTIILHNQEQWVNDKQEELNSMQIDQPDQLKKIIEKIKRENKKSKLIEIKEVAKKQEEERMMKYLQRMTIYKPHGGIVYPPPQILNRRKNIQSKSDIKQDIGYDDIDY